MNKDIISTDFSTRLVDYDNATYPTVEINAHCIIDTRHQSQVQRFDRAKFKKLVGEALEQCLIMGDA